MQELSQNTLIFLDYFFSYLSHGLYLLYFSWVDMEKDQEDPPFDGLFNRFFLGSARSILRLGLLCSNRLALGCSQSPQ